MLLILCGGRDGQIDRVIAIDISVRIILLDRDLDVQRQIAADICNAEAAFAQASADEVFPVKDGSGTEPVYDIAFFIRRMTMRAKTVLIKRFHTIITILNVTHSSHLL